jgi:hypothetical protein
MKTINPLIILISAWLIFCITEFNAQKSLQLDFFVGNWYYQGPQNPKVNDTIWLKKTLPENQFLDFTKWEFSESHVFDVGKFKAVDNDKNKLIEIREAKPVEYKWYFDNISNQLRIIKYQADVVYSVIDYQEQIIKLTRLK